MPLYTLTRPRLPRFFRRVANQVYQTDAPLFWHTIWLIPALFSILTPLFTNPNLESGIESYFFMIHRVYLPIRVFAIYHMLLSLDGLKKHMSLPQQLEGVANGELCVISGNLLENAAVACGRMNHDPKFICLDSAARRSVLAYHGQQL